LAPRRGPRARSCSAVTASFRREGAQARDTAARFYSDHARRAEQLYPRYTEKQLELLLDFLRGIREFNDRKASELETSLGRNRRR